MCRTPHSVSMVLWFGIKLGYIAAPKLGITQSMCAQICACLVLTQGSWTLPGTSLHAGAGIKLGEEQKFAGSEMPSLWQSESPGQRSLGSMSCFTWKSAQAEPVFGQAGALMLHHQGVV